MSAWQGPSADSVRTAVHQVFAAREYDWSAPGRQSLWVKALQLFGRLLAWLDRLRQVHPMGYRGVIGLLILMLAAILAHFGVIVWRAFRPLRSTPAAIPAATLVRDAHWHLAEAARLSEAGRFAEALGHRFLALVLTLDRRRAVRFDPSKTPAEYAREAQLDDAGRDDFTGLVGTLYLHVFGGVPCTADVWVEFDRRADLVGTHVAPT